jgi:hypothetical protein
MNPQKISPPVREKPVVHKQLKINDLCQTAQDMNSGFFAGASVSADRKVSPGYGFTAVPKCGNCISAPPHLPVTPCKNTIFARLRKRFDLLSITVNGYYRQLQCI